MIPLLPTKREREYARPERLADVMALIQVLALDKDIYRSEDGLSDELKGPPKSAKTWTEVARAHPEFFRVDSKACYKVSLIARHVTPEKNATLGPEFVGNILRTAVEIHDRQVRHAERWTYLVPIWVALVAGIASVFVHFWDDSGIKN